MVLRERMSFAPFYFSATKLMKFRCTENEITNNYNDPSAGNPP